jgi:hypothetical protein
VIITHIVIVGFKMETSEFPVHSDSSFAILTKVEDQNLKSSLKPPTCFLGS